MSRIGRQPIIVPQAVTMQMQEQLLLVKGQKGETSLRMHPNVLLQENTPGTWQVSVQHKEMKRDHALWGLYRRLIGNMIQGVTEGFQKQLEIIGVGYRVNFKDTVLTFQLGYSHPCVFELPAGITAQVTGNIITLSSVDKQLVGETAAQIRRLRPPEPYKGKGIRYVDEEVRRKAGKSAAKSA